jgi:hypothetical protein
MQKDPDAARLQDTQQGRVAAFRAAAGCHTACMFFKAKEDTRFSDLEDMNVSLSRAQSRRRRSPTTAPIAINADGKILVRIYRTGVYVTVRPPVGEGQAVTMAQALERAARRRGQQPMTRAGSRTRSRAKSRASRSRSPNGRRNPTPIRSYRSRSQPITCAPPLHHDASKRPGGQPPAGRRCHAGPQGQRRAVRLPRAV